MTDLERFIDLYRSVGIECKINPTDDGEQEIILTEERSRFMFKGVEITTSEKIRGFSGFHTAILFDKNGKFISQGIYE